jgi:hypothetical protein
VPGRGDGGGQTATTSGALALQRVQTARRTILAISMILPCAPARAFKSIRAE